MPPFKYSIYMLGIGCVLFCAGLEIQDMCFYQGRVKLAFRKRVLSTSRRKVWTLQNINIYMDNISFHPYGEWC